MWDKRYSTDEYVYGTSPNDFLKNHYTHLPPGKILCLAEGEGRNCVFLAAKGYEVTAVDSSRVGLEKAQWLASQHGVKIETVQADLAEYQLGKEIYSGIISIFCHLPSKIRKPLHQKIMESLAPRGIFLLEGYTPEQLKFKTGGPPSAELMLDLKTVKKEFSTFKMVHGLETKRHIQEGTLHNGLGAVVQFIGKKP